MKKLEFLKGVVLGMFIGIIAIVVIVIGISKQLRTYIRTSLNGSSTVSEVLNEVELMYISHYNKDIPEIESSKLIREYIDLVGDKWGVYMNPDESAEYVIQNSKKYCGIGIVTEYTNESYGIIRVVDNTPAKNMGLLVGDEIEGINSIDVKELENVYGEGKATSAIKGEEGTSVELLINRNGNRIKKSITRENIVIPTVECKDINDIKYIRIYEFSDTTYDELVEILENNEKYIVDLRGNSGGSFNTVVKIADTILEEGLIVKEKGNKGEEKEYISDSDCIDSKFVILVDNNTASASELLAQVLKEYGVAYIIGKNTCGKGTITDQIVLSNGGYLFISSGEYITGEEYHIEGNGVQLDEYYIDDNIIERAIDILSY